MQHSIYSLLNGFKIHMQSKETDACFGRAIQKNVVINSQYRQILN